MITRQNRRAAVLTRIETAADVQLHMTQLELDEDVCEVVLHVYDVVLKNFIAKRILLGISQGLEPRAPSIPPIVAEPAPKQLDPTIT